MIYDEVKKEARRIELEVPHRSVGGAHHQKNDQAIFTPVGCGADADPLRKD